MNSQLNLAIALIGVGQNYKKTLFFLWVLNFKFCLKVIYYSVPTNVILYYSVKAFVSVKLAFLEQVGWLVMMGLKIKLAL